VAVAVWLWQVEGMGVVVQTRKWLELRVQACIRAQVHVHVLERCVLRARTCICIAARRSSVGAERQLLLVWAVEGLGRWLVG
jgi:hypothetical protein